MWNFANQKSVDVLDCPNNCNGGNGRCNGNTCVCNNGWAGADCSISTFRNTPTHVMVNNEAWRSSLWIRSVTFRLNPECVMIRRGNGVERRANGAAICVCLFHLVRRLSLSFFFALDCKFPVRSGLLSAWFGLAWWWYASCGLCPSCDMLLIGPTLVQNPA